MRLTTISTPAGTRAGRIDGDVVTEIDCSDVSALLAEPDWRERADRAAGPTHALGDVELHTLTPRPGKIFCVGLNYRTHILEMGRDLPEHPTLFAKFPEALIGPRDVISLDGTSDSVDWEAELAVVIGRTARRADDSDAAAAIAGFAVLNDVTMRDWQFRSVEWLQGKTFEGSTPIGPELVTPDELPGGVRPKLELSCAVDGHVVQSADTSDLVFDPVALVQYISQFITLAPGDVIATGTPGGVGHARTPQQYMSDGQVLETRISHLGSQRNLVRSLAPVAP